MGTGGLCRLELDLTLKKACAKEEDYLRGSHLSLSAPEHRDVGWLLSGAISFVPLEAIMQAWGGGTPLRKETIPADNPTNLILGQ